METHAPRSYKHTRTRMYVCCIDDVTVKRAACVAFDESSMRAPINWPRYIPQVAELTGRKVQVDNTGGHLGSGSGKVTWIDEAYHARGAATVVVAGQRLVLGRWSG